MYSQAAPMYNNTPQMYDQPTPMYNQAVPAYGYALPGEQHLYIPMHDADCSIDVLSCSQLQHAFLSEI